MFLAHSLFATLLGGAVMLAWRLREARSSVTARKLLIPPLGMSTGFFMFLAPATRVPVSWAAGAFAVGAGLLSWPLIRTSKLVRRGDEVVLERSRAFVWILLGLLAIRLGLRSWLEQYVSVVQTGSLLFVFAFGLILPWRLAMYARYRRLVA